MGNSCTKSSSTAVRGEERPGVDVSNRGNGQEENPLSAYFNAQARALVEAEVQARALVEAEVQARLVEAEVQARALVVAEVQARALVEAEVRARALLAQSQALVEAEAQREAERTRFKCVVHNAYHGQHRPQSDYENVTFANSNPQHLPVSAICFSQDSIACRFRDRCRTSLQEGIRNLQRGHDYVVKVVRVRGQYVAINNRTLYCYQQAGRKSVSVEVQAGGLPPDRHVYGHSIRVR